MTDVTTPAAASAEEKRRRLAEMLAQKAQASRTYPASFAQAALIARSST